MARSGRGFARNLMANGKRGRKSAHDTDLLNQVWSDRELAERRSISLSRHKRPPFVARNLAALPRLCRNAVLTALIATLDDIAWC